MEPPFSAADAQLTQRIGLIDLHSDLPLALLKRRFDGRTGVAARRVAAEVCAQGGVNVVVCAVYIDSLFLPEGALRRAVQLVDALLEEIAALPDEVELALLPRRRRAHQRRGEVAALLAFEGAEPLGQDLAALRLFHRLGLRMLSFAWMRRTAFGDGAWENDSRGGLTRLGTAGRARDEPPGHHRRRLPRLRPTTWDVLEIVDAPVIASHSNARALRDHPRNLTDDMIRAIAASRRPGRRRRGRRLHRGAGGDDRALGRPRRPHRRRSSASTTWASAATSTTRSMAMGASQEIPAWRPAGGLGPLSVPGMTTWEHLPALTAELTRRGYAEADLRQIYRDNALRVLGEVVGS